MNIKHGLAILTLSLSCSTMVMADTDTFAKFSQEDGMSALYAGDAQGFEVLQRAELEEVRGEGFMNDVIGTIAAISIAAKVSPKVLLGVLKDVNKMYGTAWYLSTSGAKAFGWELGRAMALRDGHPDPGPFYLQSSVVRLPPGYLRMGVELYQRFR